MNLYQYKNLSRYCDKILVSKTSTSVTKSIPWLHVLNAHPTTQEKYRGLYSGVKKRGYVSVFFSAVRFFKNLLSGFWSAKYFSSHPTIKQTDFLILSHLISSNHIGGNEDFYYGDLGFELNKNNISTQILLMDHIGVNPKKTVSSWSNKMVPRLMLPNRLFLISEFLLLYSAVKEAISLYKASFFEENKILSDIYKMASLEAISFETISALRFARQFEKLVYLLQPKAILITMEGHAFERLAFHAARKINAKVQCFGYQHAILFPHQHAVKRALGDTYDPDIIFTAGNQTINVLRKGYQGYNVNVLNIGTHRYSCPKKIFDLKKPRAELSCLILPDGNISECLYLCQFAYDAAVNTPEINFRIRLHPLSSIKELISLDWNFNSLPKNLSFSTVSDIQNDFKLSKWALYRGSGSAIHAVMAGCRPIYVRSTDSINIDPLYEVKSGREVVDKTTDLEAIFHNDLLMSEKTFYRELESLFTYCKEYFRPPNFDALLEHLNKNDGENR
ncbi:hypothetical protein OAJ10_02510 [Paracoccaceae bacterium]|nr:hypothetical protein [Paracoccaceae bacterium]